MGAVHCGDKPAQNDPATNRLLITDRSDLFDDTFAKFPSFPIQHSLANAARKHPGLAIGQQHLLRASDVALMYRRIQRRILLSFKSPDNLR